MCGNNNTVAIDSSSWDISGAGAITGITGITFASSGAYNFDQSGSTGTFKTGTGAVTLNGNTTIATGNLTLTGFPTGGILYTDNNAQVQNATGGVHQVLHGGTTPTLGAVDLAVHVPLGCAAVSGGCGH